MKKNQKGTKLSGIILAVTISIYSNLKKKVLSLQKLNSSKGSQTSTD